MQSELEEEKKDKKVVKKKRSEFSFKITHFFSDGIEMAKGTSYAAIPEKTQVEGRASIGNILMVGQLIFRIGEKT